MLARLTLSLFRGLLSDLRGHSKVNKWGRFLTKMAILRWGFYLEASQGVLPDCLFPMKLWNIAQEIIQLPDYLAMTYMVVFKDTAKYKTNYLNVIGVSYRTEQANQQRLLRKTETTKRLSRRPVQIPAVPWRRANKGLPFPRVCILSATFW